jgi:LPXTG-motif cell wall-anchored protein
MAYYSGYSHGSGGKMSPYLVGAGVLVLGLLFYYYYNKKKQEKLASTPVEAQVTVTAQ